MEDYQKRRSHASDAKSAIGAAAVQFVEAGDSIIIDTGTTTLELAKHLVGIPDLTIVTNDFEVAAFIEAKMPDADLLFWWMGALGISLRLFARIAALR